MKVFLLGGAASGKSRLAEDVCARLGGPLAYIATLPPEGDPENLRRIARHRRRRAHRGFVTVERETDLAGLDLGRRYGTVLLECLGTLAANELFGGGTLPAEFPSVALAAAEALAGQADHVVVVGNHVFGGGHAPCLETRAYLRALGEAGRVLARWADAVAEVVCGIPIWRKGGL